MHSGMVADFRKWACQFAAECEFLRQDCLMARAIG